MDPVQSWLDAKEVRRMAESLMAPPPEVDKSAVDAGYGDDFEGFAELIPSEDQNSPGQQALVPRPDGRPHAQKQFVNPSAEAAVPSSADEPVSGGSRRMAAGSALADAKRLAEGSGMLGSGEPAGQPSPTSIEPSQHDSPFKVSANQQQSNTDPLARQVSPAALDAPAPLSPPLAAAPEPPAPAEPEKSTFQPDVESAQPPPVAAVGKNTSETSEPPENVGPGSDDTGAARGPFLSRLKQFSQIIRRDLDAKAMFLIDNEGQILLDEVENPKLIQVARTLANASYRASRQTSGAAAVGNLHVKIGASATLEVIPVESRYGLLILGAIFPAPLGAERVMQVADVLYKTVEPRS